MTGGSEVAPCPFCGQGAPRDSKMRKNEMVCCLTCPDCGEFFVSHIDLTALERDDQSFTADDRKKIAAVMYERQLKGLGPCVVTIDAPQEAGEIDGYPVMDIHAMLVAFPSTAVQIRDRALLNLSRMAEGHPWQEISISSKQLQPFFAIDGQQGLRIRQDLVDAGYIAKVAGKRAYHLTVDGWKYIASLEGNVDSLQAFVAISFANDRVTMFKEAIQPAVTACRCRRSGSAFTALKINDKEFNEGIVDEIIAEIRRSRFLVADLTDENNGVYYEAGFAGGIGIPVIYAVEEEYFKSHDEKLHFDVRHRNLIVYKDAADLQKRLINRIRATIT